MSNATVFVGGNVTLLCRAYSDAMPHFQWLRWSPLHSNSSDNKTKIFEPYFNYEVMKQNQQTSVVNYHGPGNDKHELLGVTLTLVDVTKKDEGKYTCLVGNALGYAKEDAYIMVQEKRGKKGEILKYIISKAKFSSDFKKCLSQVIQLLSQAKSKLDSTFKEWT